MIKMGLAQLVKLSHLNAEQQEVVNIIGIDNYRDLIDKYGGDRLYIPKAKSLIPVAELAYEIRLRRQNGDRNEQIAQDLEIPFADVRKVK